MNRNYEIDDTLQERVDGAIDETKDALIEWLNDNPDTDSTPDYGNDLDYDGRMHEIVDGSVPIYTKEIEDTWYLHRNDLEQAYENAGIGDNPLENNGMTAIYCYIQEKVYEWYHDNAGDVFDEWKTEHDAKETKKPE